MNAKAARLLDAFASLPQGAAVVEIGCARFPEERASDGFSTLYLARAARDHGWQFHSVDSDPAAVLNAARLIAGLPGTVHHADGAHWLETGAPLIDGLYLDGSADPADSAEQYAVARLAVSAVVVVDDVQRIGDHERGKGDLLLSHLETDGFVVEVAETEPGYEMAVAVRVSPTVPGGKSRP